MRTLSSSCRVVLSQVAVLGLCVLMANAQDVSTIAVTDTTNASSRPERPCQNGTGSSRTFCAEVRRTSFGIPHIKAENEKGLGYGLGYIYATDNICLLADAIVTANGERSKYFGADNFYSLHGFGDKQNNLTSDFYFKYLNDPALVNSTWQSQSRGVKDRVLGYVAGYNRYFKSAGRSGLPNACRNQPWVRELTELDLMRLMRRYAIEGSGAFFVDALYAAQPPGTVKESRPNVFPEAPARGLNAVSPADALVKDSARGVGSNAIALGSSATETGSGMLLANPHFPWSTSLRFYQLHLTIPGQLDVMGAALGGVPMVNIGFNRNVAWSHTVNTSQHYVIFALALDPKDPTRYVVDGQSKAMKKNELRVEKAAGTGKFTSETRTFYSTDFGPLIQLDPFGLFWTGQTAYALSDVNVDNTRMFQQWYELDKAKSVADYRSSVEKVLGLPWVQAIAADSAGKVYYGDVTPVPYANLKKCQIADFEPLIPYLGYVLSGTTAACKLRNDTSAPQRGIYPATALPSLQRDDFVQNSNDTAWYTNPARPLKGYDAIISADSTELSARTRYGLTQIAARLAGTDGAAGKKFALSSLQTILLSNRSYYAGSLLPELQATCRADKSPVTRQDGSIVDVAEACGVLANWDGTANLDSIGWPLFQAWRLALKNEIAIDYWQVPFNANDPVNTPRGLKSSPEVRSATRQALARAIIQLDEMGLDYTKPWGQIQIAVRGAVDIPIHGGSSDDIYNGMDSGLIRSGQLEPLEGSSAIFTVSLERDAPKAQGFLTYSQSTNEQSPYYSDQTVRFSGKQWITYPFTETAITKDTIGKSQTISE